MRALVKLGQAAGGTHVLVLVALSLGVSLVFQLVLPAQAHFIDENGYLNLARGLQDNGTFGHERFRAWHTPGYPFFIYLVLSQHKGDA